MSEERMNFTACDEMVAAFEKVIATPVTHKSAVYYTGVDLGTACVVIAVLDENKQPIAGAMRYADVVRDGMVVDYIGAVQIVRELKEEIESKLGVELVYAAGAIPPGTDTLDGGAVKNVIEGAGFECTNLLDESTAANLVLQMKNGAVVDIGGGTSEVAVISLGDIVTAVSVRMAGDKFDEAIVTYVKKKYNLLIGERTAEEIKVKIGSAFPTDDTINSFVEIKGRNLVDGLPKNVTIHADEVREALADCVMIVVDAVKDTLEKTPPELAADIIDRGIMLTGGGALLRGLDKLVSQETGIPVHVAERPLDCVVEGTGKSLEVELPKSYYRSRKK